MNSLKFNFQLKPIQVTFGWLLILCLSFASCEKEVAINEDTGPDENLIELNENKAETLASFNLSNGNRIEIVGKTTVDGDELGVIEIGKGVDVKHSPFKSSELSIPDLFFILNVNGDPIPELIARVSKRENLKTVEKLKDDINVDLNDISDYKYSSPDKFPSNGTLNNTGLYCGNPALFQANYCNAVAIPGAISICSPNFGTTYIHWVSGQKRRISTGITTACLDRGRVIHYQRTPAGWQIVHIWRVGSGHTEWTRWTGAVPRQRAIRHKRRIGSVVGMVRATSYFWN